MTSFVRVWYGLLGFSQWSFRQFLNNIYDFLDGHDHYFLDVVCVADVRDGQHQYCHNCHEELQVGLGALVFLHFISCVTNEIGTVHLGIFEALFWRVRQQLHLAVSPGAVARDIEAGAAVSLLPDDLAVRLDLLDRVHCASLGPVRHVQPEESLGMRVVFP